MTTAETIGLPLLNCFREPIPEIAEAAQNLGAAVSAHLNGDFQQTERLIKRADLPPIRDWVESILGKKSRYVRVNVTLQTKTPLAARIRTRMPNALEKRLLHERDGYHCRFCGIPVIRSEIRNRIKRYYPNALGWGKRNIQRHAAFFAMWVQYDHLLPHAKGGTNLLDNIVVACTACNYGRGGYTLDEVGLANPFLRPVLRSAWDGLESFTQARSNKSPPANPFHDSALF